jgi:hypothetical protein
MGLVRDTRDHIEALLKAAQRERVATSEDDARSPVRILRRHWR